MSRVVVTRIVSPDERDAAFRARDGLVGERALGSGRFEAAEGPVESYRRTVGAEHLPDGRVRLTETVDFRLALPYFGFLFVPAVKRLLRRGGGRPGHLPWWSAPDRLDAHTTTVLGALAALAVVAGYLGTVLTQTISFAADEFGAGNRAQGVALAAVRFDVVFALVLVALADRRGRRVVLVIGTVVGCVTTAASALAPSLPWLAATQLVSRPFVTALAIAIAVVAAEEMPAGSRAYAVAVLGLAGALGVGICVLLLPLADVDERAWRLLFALALLWLLPSLHVLRHVTESRRFLAPHAEAPMAGHGARFWLLAASSFLLNLFTTPASQFQNDFLREDRGYSGTRVSLFTVLTNTPGGIGVVAGGRVADVRGRRPVAVVAVTGGILLTVLMFATHGWLMWVVSVAGAVVGAAAIPALAVYGPELFPTSLRGRASGGIILAGRVGGVIGLLAVGALADAYGSFGPAFALVGVAPLLVPVLIALAYPETARRELEDLNPEDRLPG